jgi:D-sedoheptulose 7-phosphate isomerase
MIHRSALPAVATTDTGRATSLNKHLAQLLEAHPVLEVCASDIEDTYEVLRHCFAAEGKVLICGNGGSAADAEHWAGEMLKGFVGKRPLTGEERAGLNPKLDRLQGALPMIPLTGFLSYRTAFMNDGDQELVFAQLVWALGRPGDVLAALSTSGDSNVYLAAEAARARQMKVVALTGLGGGKLDSVADVCIRVPARDTYLVQEYHLAIHHRLTLMLEDEFFG